MLKKLNKIKNCSREMETIRKQSNGYYKIEHLKLRTQQKGLEAEQITTKQRNCELQIDQKKKLSIKHEEENLW